MQLSLSVLLLMTVVDVAVSAPLSPRADINNRTDIVNTTSPTNPATATTPRDGPSLLTPVFESVPGAEVNAEKEILTNTTGITIVGNNPTNGTNETLAAPGLPAGGDIQTNPIYQVQSNFDFQSLNLALNQEWIELDLFHNGLAKFSPDEFEAAGLTAEDQYLIQYMAEQEVGHALLLTSMIGPDRAAKQCTYRYPYETVQEFILFCHLLTRWGESGTLGFLPHLDSRPVAQDLLQSITTESRQEMIFRQFNLFPRLNITNQPNLLGNPPAITTNTSAYTAPGDEIQLAWDAPGVVTGYDDLYETSTLAGEPKYAAFISQLNVTYAPLYNVDLVGRTAAVRHPAGNVYPGPTAPIVNETVFLSLVDDTPFLTPYNISIINNHTVAGPALYQSG